MEEKARGERLWTRSFVLAFASRCFTSTVFSLLNVVVAAYAMEAYGADASLAGLAAGVFILASVPSRLAAGALLERVGRRRMLVLTSGLLVVACGGYLVQGSIVSLVVVRCLHGAAHGASSNTLTAIATDLVPVKRLGEGLGFLSLSSTLAMAAGPFAGLALLQQERFFTLFLLCEALTFVGFLLTLALVPLPRVSLSIRPTSIIERSAVPLSSVVFLICVASSCVTAFLAPFAEGEGMGNAAPWFFVVNAAGMLIARLASGRLQDRCGDDAVVSPLAASLAAGLAVLCVSGRLALLVAALLVAIGYGGLFPCLQAAVVRGVPSMRLGVATSTFFTFTDTGLGLGPLVGGLVAAGLGFRGLFAGCSVLVVVAMALYLRVCVGGGTRRH